MGLLLSAAFLQGQRTEWQKKHLIYKRREDVSTRPPIQLKIAPPRLSPDTETGLLPSKPGAIPEVEVCLSEAPPSRSSQNRVYVLFFDSLW